MRRIFVPLLFVLVGCGAEPATIPSAQQAAQGPVAANATPAVAAPTQRPQPTAEQIAVWEEYNARPAQPLELVACYDGFADPFIQCVAVSPDGKRFAIGGSKLTLWNFSDAKPIVNLIEKLQDEKDIERPIRSLAFSADGAFLAAGDQRGMLRVWNVADQAERFAIRAHDARLTRLAISPDSKTLATTSYSGEVRLWNAADGAKEKAFKADAQEVQGLVFLTNKLLATSGQAAVVWNVETGDKVAVLTTGRKLSGALALSSDRKLLAFADADAGIKFWDVKQQATTNFALASGAGHLAFSGDGAWVAAYVERTVRIFNAKTQSLVQVIDADGDRTTGLQWLPQGNALLIASENGCARMWSDSQTAVALGLPRLERQEPIILEQRRVFSPREFAQVIDVRSFPRLPNAVPQFRMEGAETYNAPAIQAEADMFYRWACEKAGWKEQPAEPSLPGLAFKKDGCFLHVSMNPAIPPTPGRDGDIQVSLRFSGDTDVRKLPKVAPSNSKSGWGSFASVSYRTKKSLTDTEVELLKALARDGWAPYTRLNASSVEDPKARHLSFVRVGSVLRAFLARPADAADEVAVQLGVHPTQKVIPIPGPADWLEFDNSTEIHLVANSADDLARTVEFYDTEMKNDGWRRRDAGRVIDEEKQKAWLPYFRGQQDVLVRLVALPEGGTRIIVGDAEGSSWQLAKPKPNEEKPKPGIEAADFKLPAGAAGVKFDVDAKKIEFEVAGGSTAKLVDWFVAQMTEAEWKRDGAGVLSEEYSLVTFEQDKTEIELRARAADTKATAMISGDGLLWSKPLPAAPIRISYETWLRRNQKKASLGFLDEFLEEMHKIPEPAGR